MTKRERLIKAIKGERVDRTPVIAPAGLVGSLPSEVLEPLLGEYGDFIVGGSGRNPEVLANLSVAFSEETGFESLGLPYLMTVESEAYGGETECGLLSDVPSPYEYPYVGPEQYKNLPELNPVKDGRMPVVVETIRLLRDSYPDMPVVADIVAPVSLATSLMDASTLFKSFIKTPLAARAFLEKLTDSSIRFMEAQIRAGADIVFITDPASTVDNLGPKFFGEFSIPFINKLSKAAIAGGALPVVHICGQAKGFLSSIIDELLAPCVSLDSISDIEPLSGKFSIMGGVSSSSLCNDAPDEVKAFALTAAKKGLSILAPSCGLSRDVPLESLKAFTAGARYKIEN